MNKLLAVYLFVAAVGITGYAKNIINVFNADYDSISGFEVVSVVGIFVPPVGTVTGLYSFFR